MSTKQESNPVLLLQRLDEQRKALLGDIKKRLMKQLEEAGDTYRVLLQMNETDTLKEPPFYEIRALFNIETGLDSSPKKKDKRSSGDRKPRLDLQLHSFLAKQGTMNAEEVVKHFANEGTDKVRATISKRSSGLRPILKLDGQKVSAIVKP